MAEDSVACGMQHTFNVGHLGVGFCKSWNPQVLFGAGAKGREKTHRSVEMNKLYRRTI